jgi:hypothetical protein
MKMRDALEELKVLADGRYCSVSYSIAIGTDGKEIVGCSVYIDDGEGGKAAWEENFKRALSEIQGKEKEEEQDIEG